MYISGVKNSPISYLFRNCIFGMRDLHFGRIMDFGYAYKGNQVMAINKPLVRAISKSGLYFEDAAKSSMGTISGTIVNFTQKRS